MWSRQDSPRRAGSPCRKFAVGKPLHVVPSTDKSTRRSIEDAATAKRGNDANTWAVFSAAGSPCEDSRPSVLSTFLLVSAIILIGFKFFNLKARLRELGRMLDGIVNVLLVVIVVSYCVQVAILYWKK